MAMEEAQRWSVTYTKHVQQKRKVYHDGFLVIQSSRNKVMLYDEWDKLLETRFVKKDDLIVSGETVTFGSYLVDLGELCQGHQPTSVLNTQNQDKKVSETSSSFYGYNSQNRKPMVGKRKARGFNISPSQKMIRDFKKSEMNKVSSSPNCMDMTNLSTKEWQVLYTTQITQKAKKFHDGFLQLIVRGSQGRQVKLYDANRRHLDGRFLKRDEIVSSGESLFLDGHIVEIGEKEECKSPTDINSQAKSCIVVGKSGMVDYQAKIPINKNINAGKPPGDSSQETLTKLSDSSYQSENAKSSRGDTEPKRSVCDIMSILKQPSGRKDNSVKSFAEGCTESHSTEFQSDTKNHIKECAEESSATAGNDLREKGPEHDSILKAVKIEPVDKVTIDVEELAVSENERVPQARSHPRPEAVNLTSSTHDVQDINRNKYKSSSSFVKSTVTATANGDFRKEKESESLTRSYKKQEPENPSIIYSCEQVATESNAALSSASSFCKLPESHKAKKRVLGLRPLKSSEKLAMRPRKVQDGKKNSSSRGNNDCTGLKESSLKEGLNKQDTDEFPSFDLGIL